MSNFQLRKLFGAVFLCSLMFVVMSSNVFADVTTDTSEVTVTAEAAVVCMYASVSDASADWSVVIENELNDVYIDVGYDEIDAGEVILYSATQGPDYVGYLHWEANCDWTCRLAVTYESDAWIAQDFDLWVKTGSENSWTPLGPSPSSWGSSNGNERGAHDVDWKVTGLGFDDPATPVDDPGYYHATVLFTVSPNEPQ